jgi:predicted nucleic-acid-binding Zn-ribbon protein
MRTSHRCPKCDHDEVLYVPELTNTDHDRMTVSGGGGFTRSLGDFEAYLCRKCGYSELYVNDAGALDVAQLPNGSTVLKALPRTGYR